MLAFLRNAGQVEALEQQRDVALQELAEAEKKLKEEKAVSKDLQGTVSNLQRVLALSHSCRDTQETALNTRIEVLTREMEILTEARPFSSNAGKPRCERCCKSRAR